eukprot:106469_1
MCDILKMMRCCGTNTEETEEVILSHDLESGVDITKDGTTADSEIHGFEKNVEKSLRASNEDISIATYVAILACYIILMFLYVYFFPNLKDQKKTLLHELRHVRTQTDLDKLNAPVDEWLEKSKKMGEYYGVDYYGVEVIMAQRLAREKIKKAMTV